MTFVENKIEKIECEKVECEKIESNDDHKEEFFLGANFFNEVGKIFNTPVLDVVRAEIVEKTLNENADIQPLEYFNSYIEYNILRKYEVFFNEMYADEKCWLKKACIMVSLSNFKMENLSEFANYDLFEDYAKFLYCSDKILTSNIKLFEFFADKFAKFENKTVDDDEFNKSKSEFIADFNKIFRISKLFEMVISSGNKEIITLLKTSDKYEILRKMCKKNIMDVFNAEYEKIKPISSSDLIKNVFTMDISDEEKEREIYKIYIESEDKRSCLDAVKNIKEDFSLEDCKKYFSNFFNPDLLNTDEIFTDFIVEIMNDNTNFNYMTVINFIVMFLFKIYGGKNILAKYSCAKIGDPSNVVNLREIAALAVKN